MKSKKVNGNLIKIYLTKLQRNPCYYLDQSQDLKIKTRQVRDLRFLLNLYVAERDREKARILKEEYNASVLDWYHDRSDMFERAVPLTIPTSSQLDVALRPKAKRIVDILDMLIPLYRKLGHNRELESLSEQYDNFKRISKCRRV